MACRSFSTGSRMWLRSPGRWRRWTTARRNSASMAVTATPSPLRRLRKQSSLHLIHSESQDVAMTVLFQTTIPILRIFSVDKAKEFYVDYLGFKVDWEHHFEENTPAYIQVSRD